MYIVVLLIAFIQVIIADSIFLKPDIIYPGGPGTIPELDRYNAGDWNRTHHPAEPQQIHATWISNGVSFKVQFSTMRPVKKCILQYWLNEDDIDGVTESIDWEFTDEGTAKSKQYMHILTTGRLEPSNVYKYRIVTVYKKRYYSEIFEIHTPENHTKSFKFLATGDLGIANAVSMPALKELAHNQEYDFVAIMGDQGYDLADFNGTKGDQYLNFAQELYANLPVLATAGNHEKTYNFSHYKNRFDLLPYRESNFQNSLQYSIDYKSLHFISFSTEVFFGGSNEEIDTALNWLEQDLIKANKARSKVPWIIVVGHRPLYCSISHDSDCEEDAQKIRFGPNKNRGLETLLTKYNVDLYLCGHKHNYERSYPISNNSTITRSYHNSPQFFQIITGNAGNYKGPEKFDVDCNPNWLAYRYQGYGFTSFEISPSHINIYHHTTNIDGTLGNFQDFVRVSKSKSYIHKQKIIN